MADAPKKLDLMAAIYKEYPDATPAEIKASLTSEFLSAAYGKMPGYSTLAAPALHVVKTATVGSFVICHGTDTAAGATRGEPLIAIVKRTDKGPNGEDRFGLLGGYTTLGTEKTGGEQPKEGAVRELKEEAIGPDNQPIISPNPDRLKLIDSGIDYKNAKLPTNYNGHTLELTAIELASLKEHSRKMEQDPEYKAAVLTASGGEVADLKLLPLSEVLAMQLESFTYSHEFKAVKKLAEQLKQQVQPAR